LLDAGVTSFGENRVQELEEKRAALQGLRPTASIRWELIGPLQSNKVRRAVALADRISSVDRIELLEALVRAAREATKELHVALQVNVDNDPAKAGFSAAALRAALPAIGVAIGGGGVIIDGLFTVGRMVATAEEARATFTALRSVAVDVRPAAMTVGFTIGPLLSMGISGDYEVAVEEGATQVRLGSAIFGARA
jgi:pyridoxal phosphate enzyme (YggS family)